MSRQLLTQQAPQAAKDAKTQAALPRKWKGTRTRLTVNESDDVYENEAERIAEQVKTAQIPLTARQMPLPISAANTNTANQNVMAANTGLYPDSGLPLPHGVKRQFEDYFQQDFSSVKIRTDNSANSLCSSLHADAFTYGQTIFFRSGSYAPETSQGRALLAHELVHVVQQQAHGNAFIQRRINRALLDNTDEQVDEELIVEDELEQANNPANHASQPVSVISPPTQTGNQADADTTVAEEALIPADSDMENAEVVSEQSNQPEAAIQSISTVAPTEHYPLTPEDDPAFNAAVDAISGVTEQQRGTRPAEAEASIAQQAAVVPANEQASIAQINQLGEMAETAEQESNAFDPEAFKSQLMQRIANMQLPATQGEADDFENHNNLEEIAQATAGDVANERANATRPLTDVMQAEPDTDGIPERQSVGLPEAPVGSRPANIGGVEAAMPRQRPEQQVSQPLQQAVQAIDQEMAADGITEAQLASANEPVFNRALVSIQDVRANSESAPLQFRQSEEEILSAAQGNASQLSAEGLLGMHGDRVNILNQVVGEQVSAGEQDTAARAQVISDINGIYENTKLDVDGILNGLDETVSRTFDEAAQHAKSAFQAYVDEKMFQYKLDRYLNHLVPGHGAVLWLRDLALDLPDEVNQFFVDGRALYIATMDVALTDISLLVAERLTSAKLRIEQGRQAVTNYVSGLEGALRTIGESAAEDIQARFDELSESVNGKQGELIDSLAERYQSSLSEVDARIEEMQAENEGLISSARNAYNEAKNTILQLKQMLTDLLSAIQSIIDVIISRPAEFARNLFAGVRQGFDNFVSNIQTHLMGGFIQWLTGSLGSVGITIPEDVFSLKGIFSLVTQVLGLTWDYIRSKAVRLVGEPIVQAMEYGVEVFQIIRDRGVMGLWEHIKEEFNDLKEQVIDSIKEMLITQVVMAGIRWLVSLLIPGAGFIKAIIAIKDFVVFFVESAMALIPTIIEAIRGLVSGGVSMVAGAIERGLVLLLPMVINLFARIIGLSSLADKVGKIIKRLRARIDRAINKIIIKAKKALRRLGNRFRQGVGRITEWWKTRKRFRADDGHQHTLYFDGEGSRATLMIASTPQTFRRFISGVDVGNDQQKRQEKDQALQKLNRIEVLTQETSAPNNAGGTNDRSKADEMSRLLDEVTNYIKSFFAHSSIAKYIGKEISSKDRMNYVINEQQKNEIKNAGYTLVPQQAGRVKIYIRCNKNPPVHIADDGKLMPGCKENSEHNYYKPFDITDVQERDGRYFIEYKTKTSTGESGPSFEVDVTYKVILDDNDDETKELNIVGRQLKRKRSGSRGRTNSAKRGFENAHLIADRFGGSGYNRSQNLYPSSPEYNHEDMLRAEDAIDDHIREKEYEEFIMEAKAVIRNEKYTASVIKRVVDNNVNSDLYEHHNVDWSDGDALKKFISEKIERSVRKDILGLPGQFTSVHYRIGNQEVEFTPFRVGRDEKYDEAVKKLMESIT